MLTAFVSFGDDFASSTLDVMSQTLVSFNTPIIIILGVGLFAGILVMIIRAMIHH